MKNRVLLPLALILLLWLPRAEARDPATQPNIADPDIIRGIEHIYNLEFDRAEELFRRKIAAVPNEPTSYFYLAMVSWSRLAAGFWSPDVIETYGDAGAQHPFDIEKAIKMLVNKAVQTKATGVIRYYDDDGQTVILTHTPTDEESDITRTPS